MPGEYVSPCGCKIHVIQWTSRRKVVTQESCPLHKNAEEVLRVLKDSLAYTELSYLVRPQDVKAWREAIAKSEG